MPRSDTDTTLLERLTPQYVVQRIEALRAERPAFLSFLVFLAAAALVLPVSLDYWLNSDDFWVNVLAEAHGMLMDLLIFGCLLIWFDQKAERKRRIERYEDEISDFLGWEAEESVHRIVGNVRRLNREDTAPRTLQDAYLPGADLGGADLQDTKLDGATLQDANLQDANLAGAYLGAVDLSGADLRKADLSKAQFGRYADLFSSQQGGQPDLTDANLRGVDLRGARNIKVEALCKAKTLYKARLDADLEEQVQATCPELLELPQYLKTRAQSQSTPNASEIEGDL